MRELEAQFGVSENEKLPEMREDPFDAQLQAAMALSMEDHKAPDAAALGMTEAEFAQQKQMMESYQTTGQGMIGPMLPPDFRTSNPKPKSDQGSMDMNMSDGEVKENPVIVEEI